MCSIFKSFNSESPHEVLWMSVSRVFIVKQPVRFIFPGKTLGPENGSKARLQCMTNTFIENPELNRRVMHAVESHEFTRRHLVGFPKIPPVCRAHDSATSRELVCDRFNERDAGCRNSLKFMVEQTANPL